MEGFNSTKKKMWIFIQKKKKICDYVSKICVNMRKEGSFWMFV